MDSRSSSRYDGNAAGEHGMHTTITIWLLIFLLAQAAAPYQRIPFHQGRVKPDKNGEVPYEHLTFTTKLHLDGNGQVRIDYGSVYKADFINTDIPAMCEPLRSDKQMDIMFRAVDEGRDHITFETVPAQANTVFQFRCVFEPPKKPTTKNPAS